VLVPFPPGYRVRAPRLDDGPAIVRMLNDETRALVGVEFTSLDWVTAPWTAPGADLERDFGVVLAPDGAIAGYFFLSSDAPHTSVFSIGGVALAHHGRGVGSAIVEELERRAAAFSRLAPAGEPVVWRMGALAEEPQVAALLAAHGFVERRIFWAMHRRFDGPPEPPGEVPGIAFDVIQPGREADVYDCLAEAFEDHFGDSLAPREIWLHTHVTAVEHHDPSLWHVARREGRVVGALLGLAQADEDPAFGHVDLLGVRRAERGRGIGEALLRRSFAQFHDRGRSGVTLIVDSESTTGATRLYERAGMTAQPRFSNWERTIRQS
jgi:ribosomal protein S18 acetylase RimI-like enzyme